MQVEESYDLVVIGDQLSGFFLAAGAAQAGLKVLIIEGTTSSTALYEVPSGNFLTDLLWEPIVGLSSDSKMNRFFKSLGLYQEPEELFPVFSPSLQILSDQARLDMSYIPEEQSKEWAREFPAIKENLERWNKLLSVNGKMSFANAVQEAGLGVDWEQYGDMQMALYGSYMPINLMSSTFHALTKQAAQSVRYAIGGRSALKERLIGRLQVFGGKIKRNTWVEEIVFEKGKLAGVLLSSFEGFVRSPQVVGSMGAQNFFHLIPEKFQSQKLEKKLAAIQPKYWRLSFTVKVPEELIPEGMAQHLAVHEFQSELEQEDFLQVLALSRDMYGGIAPNQRALLIRVLMPFEERSLEPRFIATVMKRSLKNLDAFIPNLLTKKISVSPDPENLGNDSIYQKYFNFKSLQHIPPSFLVYESALNQVQENILAADWSEYGLSGVTLCSRDVHPLYGMMGEAMSAMELLEGMQKNRAEGKMFL